MAQSQNSVNVSVATFNDWVTITNSIADAINTTVVTTNTSVGGFGVTTGNAYINGVFSANTIAATQYLRGGNNSTNTNLVITTNASVNGVFTANTLVSNNLNVGQNVNTASFTANTYAITGSSANQSIDTFTTTSYRTAKYLVQVSNGTTGHQCSEILVIQDGTNVFLTEFAMISNTGTALGTFGANISGGSVNLLFSPSAINGGNVYFQRTTLSV